MVDLEFDNGIWNEILELLLEEASGDPTQSVRPLLPQENEAPTFGIIDTTTISAAPPPFPPTATIECPVCHGPLVISDGFGCGRGHVTKLSHAHGCEDRCGTERRSCCQCKKYILPARHLNRLCNFELEGFLLWRSPREPVDRVTVSPYVEPTITSFASNDCLLSNVANP
jgi:hypothetical protein